MRAGELRHQRPRCARLRLVIADLQSLDLPGESQLADGRGLDQRHPRLIQGPGFVQDGGKPLMGDLVSLCRNTHATSSRTFELDSETHLHDNATVGADLPLIARRTELALLTSAIEAAKCGRGDAVLITGEAGVGKPAYWLRRNAKLNAGG